MAYIRTDTAAKILNCNVQTVRKWIREGKLKAYRIEGARNYLLDADEVALLPVPKEGGETE